MWLREAETKKRDTNVAIGNFRHEVEDLKAQNHSTISKRTSLRLPKIELEIFGPSSNKTTSLRTIYDAIEQHLRLLHSLGEDIKTDRLIDTK